MLSIRRLNEESYNKEALLVGILWNKPEYYDSHSEEQLNTKTMGNTKWAFYLGLGRYLHDRNITRFDDISVYGAVSELSMTERFEKYGGYDVIEELMEETKVMLENFEGYYEEVKKYALMREYFKLFGKKVLEVEGAYNYKNLSANQISMYWNDKINNIDIEHNETTIVAYNVLENLEAFVEKLDVNPDIGMPLYRGRKLSESINGWARGTLSILGAFSGNGKSSMVMHSIVMGCIAEKEKLLIIANEMDLEQYQQIMLVTIMGTELYSKFKRNFKRARFNRKNINKGSFTPEEKEKLQMAVDWVNESKENSSLIKLVPLEDYTMENVEMTVRKYARRGYHRVVIDTAKPSEGGNKERWQQFVEDFDRLYKLARKDAGGLNLAMFTTIQSADTMVNRYWLNEQSIADGKKIKNVADLVWHIRPVFPQECEGGDKELEVYNWRPREEDMFNQDDVDEDDDDVVSFTTSDGKQMIKTSVKLKRGKIYYLLFTSKNRRGQTNITGLDVLVYEVDFNSNRWKEIGWTNNVFRDDI